MRSTLRIALCICLLGASALSVGAASAPETRVSAVYRPDVSKPNSCYPGNRPPLLPSPLIKLPFGAIKPQGWLRKQLQLEADGFQGHLTEISGYLKKEGNAWLSPDGRGHSGWEEMPYWLRGFSALGFMLDDKRIIDETKVWLEPTIRGQRENGYFGTQPNLGDGRAPDMMPNMNMLHAMRSYYEYTGDKRVINVMTKYFKWQLSIPDSGFFSGGWQFPRNGDNMDSVYWLYNRTGDKFLLDLGDKLMRTGARWMERVGGGHNVNYSQGFRKPAMFYQQSKDPKYLEATETNYNDMYDVYGQVPGGMFGGDEFARPGHTDPQQAIESCGTAEMMLSCEVLMRITGDLKWADRCENSALNTLPASMTADFKAIRYLTSPNQVNSDKRSKSPVLANGGPMQVMNPWDHRCCQHNVSMAWPYFAANTWQATPGNGLAAIFYAPSVVTAKVGSGTKVTITENTHYPFDGRVEFTISTPKGVKFPLYLRVPGWCENPRVVLNGKELEVSAKPRMLVMIDRKWVKGDKLVVDFPMQIRIRTWAKNQNAVSVDRGPLTFSVRISEKYVRSGGTDKWLAWEIFPTTPWNYGLVLDKDDPAKSFEIVKNPWPTSEQPFVWDQSPVELKVKAKKIPNWTENYWGLVDKLQPSPVKSDEPLETISMIPMGAGRLRLAAIPTIEGGTDAHEWHPCEEPTASFFGPGSYDAIIDGRLPRSSDDRRTPHFTWWALETKGTKQWIKLVFKEPKEVSSTEVYWYDEKTTGGCHAPESWKLYYKDGDQWKEVGNPSGYGVELDKFNKVTFDPVKTKELKIEAQFKPNSCSGIHEWRAN